MAVRVGMRLRCDTCGSEAIITASGDAELQCCGTAMTVTFEPEAPASSDATGGGQG